jgi:hypothetical protein
MKIKRQLRFVTAFLLACCLTYRKPLHVVGSRFLITHTPAVTLVFECQIEISYCFANFAW